MRRWKCRRVERGREEKKLRRRGKGRTESQAVDHAKDVNKYNRCIRLFGINFWSHSPHSSLVPPSHHPSITFTQPLQPYPPLPPTLPPTPFHLLHPLSASFSFVGGDRGGQEAVEKRRGKAQRIPRGGTDIGTCRKAMKIIHFTLHARQNALARPMLYNGAAVFGSRLKRIVPTNIGNSFKEKLKGN